VRSHSKKFNHVTAMVGPGGMSCASTCTGGDSIADDSIAPGSVDSVTSHRKVSFFFNDDGSLLSDLSMTTCDPMKEKREAMLTQCLFADTRGQKSQLDLEYHTVEVSAADIVDIVLLFHCSG
jgi:hypothetical protein